MQDKSSKEIICLLLKEFYHKGWCSGSGGGISIRESDDCIYVAPSGVLKEYVQENEIYQVNIEGEVVKHPESKNNLKPSECTPLFNTIYKLRKAGAAIHSHSINTCMITRLFDQEVQVIDFEMIKGILGHKNSEFCIVPIIENTEKECELTERLQNALLTYPRAQGVLVRNHGFYVFGSNWEKAKIHAECYDYLFNVLIEMKKLGISPKITKAACSKQKAWYLDEEQMKQDEQNNSFDLRNPYQKRQYDWVSSAYLEKLGILYWKLDGEQENQELQKIRKDRQYTNFDTVKIGAKQCQNYQELLNKFKVEHIHYDEEIRYIMEGSGFFDVRSHDDKWIRIHVTKGDMIVLPEGIYHRFSTDHSDYTHAMRLFKDEPKWTPYPRPDDESQSRKLYVQQFITPQKMEEN